MEEIRQLSYKFRQLLNKPGKILFLCLFIFMISLFINGTLWRVWGLQRDQARILEQIENTQKHSKSLDVQIKQAKDPVFIERQARDKQDMVSENDLVFVFNE